MKATPLIVNWHHDNNNPYPIYSAHFEPGGKGRLATAAGDNNVRLWKIEENGDGRKVEYLATLSKHTQAVNVVRWAPKGELLASAGDDGNVILWVPSETHHPTFGSDGLDDKETWRTKHMCRSLGTEIYDLAWSPDAQFFIIGSMDNVARIYNAGTGTLVRQIAEHSHYVQGVAWDPMNEYIATQSSDRSVHIYSLKTKDGQYTLYSHDDKPPKVASHVKADLPPRRISQSPAPDSGHRALDSVPGVAVGSPVPSAPGTPQSMPLPMNPPSMISHSRRSSFSSRRSASPAPSMPLPAVMPIEASPKPHLNTSTLGMKNANLYANETLTSFFRRLTFTPDGSLLLTPAGQYQTQHQTAEGKTSSEIINTVYIYSRGGINKPPIAHLPGSKKPSVAVRCSPVIYTLRQSPPKTQYITIDTSSAEEGVPSLPEPISKPEPTSSMDPPPPPPPPPPPADGSTAADKGLSVDTNAQSAGPKSQFGLPYRMVYAVATQDTVFIYDTQQNTPIAVVSNLHCATFTDLTWSSDGLTLLISSSDGFCSTVSFAPGELGTQYTGEIGPPRGPLLAGSNHNTPTATPTSLFAPPSPFPNGSMHRHRDSGSLTAPSPPITAFVNPRAASPARSNSGSSQAPVLSNPPLVGGQVPSIAAANSGKVIGVPVATPPETPKTSLTTTAVAAPPPTSAPSSGTKREGVEGAAGEKDGAQQQSKRRRIAPTLVSGLDGQPVSGEKKE